MKYGLTLGLLISSLVCLAQTSTPDSPEAVAKASFELFKNNQHEELVDKFFCDDDAFWAYTWKSFGSPDSLNNEETRNGMKALHGEFEAKFSASLTDYYEQGKSQYNINWEKIDEYTVKVHEKSFTVRGITYEVLIPITSFHYEDQHLMWGYETLVRTESGALCICAKKAGLGPYKEMKSD